MSTQVQNVLLALACGVIATLAAKLSGFIYWPVIAAAFIVVLVLIWPQRRESGRPGSPGTDEGTRRGRTLFFMGTAFVVCVAIWAEILGPELSKLFISERQVTSVVSSHRWITYGPRKSYPPPHRGLDAKTIVRELGWIRAAGYDGIITFSSADELSIIPELAWKSGLHVIMGVWDPNNRQEIMAAISKKRWVDAYCVGHEGLDRSYTFGELARAIKHVRFRTRLPVTTTEKIGQYQLDARLLSIGDWVFPDAHVSLRGSGNSTFRADAVRDARATCEMAKLMAEQVRDLRKPILLKMVTYPMAGIDQASLEQQAAFFVAVLDGRRDVLPDVPGGVFVSVHSAFDDPWKKSWPFFEWDPYTGLLDSNGTPRPASAEIVERLP